uniref:Target of rapamycin complex 2 subunit MAPKAP1 n=1 Tax=Aceria tosichella TaxID=561515 RepID=A0A6G1S8I1_9ACAR
MMALFDDRRFLLSHINHSFITGDDTGICEVVMLDEDVIENQHQICLELLGQNSSDKSESRLDTEAYDLNYESELFESEQGGQSYDIASDLEYMSHRRRSNTAQRLDRLKKDKINQSKTRTIVWRCNSPTSSSEDRLSHESPTHENETEYVKKPKSPPKESALTRLLEKFPSLPKNPFSEYAQFDGGMSEAGPVKKIRVFIALNNQQQTNYEVVIVSNAKVQDLIGLTCWQYTNEGREPKLHNDINKYCLRIAEDNGEVDPDFSSLNPKEPLLKFNFPSLALTEKTEEPVRTHNEPRYTNGSVYSNQAPQVTSGVKISNPSRFAAMTRIFFKDAKLDVSQ